jgi:hypothetical protein
MNFDELLEYCTKLNESALEKCLICHIPIEKNDKYLITGCSHHYHIDCAKYKKNTIQCMYCEKVTTPKLFNNEGVDITCQHIMTSGKNKGIKCGRIDCKYHKAKNNNDICKCIIKSGIKKGTQCGRKLPCAYHNMEIEMEL